MCINIYIYIYTYKYIYILYYNIYIYHIYIIIYMSCAKQLCPRCIGGKMSGRTSKGIVSHQGRARSLAKTFILSSSTERHLILCVCWHQISATLWHHLIEFSYQKSSTQALLADMIPDVCLNLVAESIANQQPSMKSSPNNLNRATNPRALAHPRTGDAALHQPPITKSCKNSYKNSKGSTWR